MAQVTGSRTEFDDGVSIPRRVRIAFMRTTSRLADICGATTPPSGSSMQETRLSEALGVSRTPLREAMKLLAAEGLVELRPNRSPRIAEIERDRILELFEALAGIERLAAELAAQRATDRELQRLRLLQTRMEKHHRDGRLDDYFAINGEIHGLIVRAARNAPLREAHETLLSRAERSRYLALGP